jgi:hypothetical protein
MKSYISQDILPGDLMLVGYHNYITLAICKSYDSEKNLFKFYLFTDVEEDVKNARIPIARYIIQSQYHRIVKYDESLLNIEQLDKYLKIKRLLSKI